MYDQRHLNSCSANALAAALRMDEAKQHEAVRSDPSRLFIYYNERLVARVVDDNAAVSLRDGYKTIARFGACPESMWPYDERLFRRKPAPACYRAGLRHVAIEYYRIRRTLAQLRRCLAERFPFVFGVAVHQSFLSSRVRATGTIPMPARGDRYLGGHAVLAVGYLHARRVLIFRNSWGARWGDRGYGYLPYAYLMSDALAWDFWTMRRVT